MLDLDKILGKDKKNISKITINGTSEYDNYPVKESGNGFGENTDQSDKLVKETIKH